MNLQDVTKELLKDEEFKKEWCIPDAEGIRFFRLKERLTQKELAKKCGLKQSAISRLENNSDEVTLKLIGKISYALGYRATLKFEKL